MSLWELFVIAVGLSMDAFAVAVCKGLSVGQAKFKHLLTAGLYFGFFQAIMPLIGFFIGVSFQSTVEFIDHWIAFILLAFIGFNMIKESLGDDEELDASFSVAAMLPLAIATSIDALATGVSYAFFPNFHIVPAVIFIGVTTFVLSAIGVYMGSHFGTKYRAKSEMAGGIILIAMGLKILLEHLNII